MHPVPSLLQAVEAAQLAEDLKVQLEHTQAKLKEIQVSVAENRTARERESSNLKRAQVCCVSVLGGCHSKLFPNFPPEVGGLHEEFNKNDPVPDAF